MYIPVYNSVGEGKYLTTTFIEILGEGFVLCYASSRVTAVIFLVISRPNLISNSSIFRQGKVPF